MSRKSIWKIFLFCLFNLIFLTIFALEVNESHDMQYGLFAIIQGTLGVLLLKDVYPIYSLAPLFLIFSEIMHFGQALLLGIGRYDLFNYLNIDLAGNIVNYNIANIFAFSIQSMVIVGMLIAAGTDEKYKIRQVLTIDKVYANNQKLSYKVGLLLFLIGVFPTVLYYGKMLQQTLSGTSYVGIRESVDIGPLLLLTVFFHPGIFLMIMGSSKNKVKAKSIFWLACTFEMISMLTGNRGKQLMYLIVYVFIYYRFIGKFNWKRVIPLALIGYVGIAFMYAISSTRLYGFASFGFDSFLKILKGEPLLALLAEQGSTLNIVALAIRDVPTYTPFSLGFQYLISLLSVLPDTGGWQGNLPSLVNTLNYLNTKLPLGDSYIAELYHNFGWFSLPFAILIGFFIGRVTKRIEFFIKTSNYLWLGSYFILFGKLLWMVRCNFFNFLFDFVWSSIIIFVLFTIVAYNSKKNKRLDLEC